MIRFEEVGYEQGEEALSFLRREPVRNLRIIWALSRWGLFDLGLPEQGRLMAARGPGGIEGLLFLNNQGLWRLAAQGERALGLAGEALARWGMPEVLAGPEDEIEALLEGIEALRDGVAYREKEVSLLLGAGAFRPRRGEARLAGEADLEDLVLLEGMMQDELLGSRAEPWVIRSQMRRAVEGGAAALVRRDGRAVSKAEMEATTRRADELGGVYTLPSCRGRGFAAWACTLVCESSLNRGKEVRLETQRDNRAALSFYGGLGFRVLWPHLAVRFKTP